MPRALSYPHRAPASSLDALPPVVQQAFAMLARRTGPAAVAGALGRSVATIQDWQRRYPHALDTARMALLEDARRACDDLKPDAWAVVADVLRDTDGKPEFKLKAAEIVFAYGYGRPPQTQIQHGLPPLTIVFTDRPERSAIVDARVIEERPAQE